LNKLMLRGGQLIGPAKIDLQRAHKLLAPGGGPAAAVKIAQRQEPDIALPGDARLH
jgi:hypothetical protein